MGKHKDVHLILVKPLISTDSDTTFEAKFHVVWKKRLPVDAVFEFKGERFAYTGIKGVDEEGRLTMVYALENPLEIPEEDIVRVDPNVAVQILDAGTGEITQVQ